MATPLTSFYDPGSHTVFVPKATSILQVEFSRTPTSFKLSEYMQIIPGQPVAGLYAELSSTDPVTIVDQNANLWQDGHERPTGRKRPLRWRQWRSERRSYPYTLGNLIVDQASFDVVAAHARGEAARAMTDRTIDAKDVLTTTANWPAANKAATIAALLGAAGSWTIAASEASQFIKQSFNKVKQSVAQQTGGVVSPSQLQLVINPITAGKMALAEEIRVYLKNHSDAMAALRGNDRAILDNWGLPPILYGIEIVVEDAVVQTSQREIDGTGTVGYAFPSDQAVFISRIGGLIGGGTVNGNAAPSFTTLTGFFHEELAVETDVDTWNRVTRGAVTDTRDIVLTAPNSGFLISDVTQ